MRWFLLTLMALMLIDCWDDKAQVEICRDLLVAARTNADSTLIFSRNYNCAHLARQRKL